jgi:hypothetical protein
MAVIHRTTLTPSKLELLAAWLPAQPWYAGTVRQPALAKAGGFRLDDPAGEVGIEFMVVTDSSGDQRVSYHVPLSYRAAPLDGADDALIGTAEHGVLGTRWIYESAGCSPRSGNERPRGLGRSCSKLPRPAQSGSREIARSRSYGFQCAGWSSTLTAPVRREFLTARTASAQRSSGNRCVMTGVRSRPAAMKSK